MTSVDTAASFDDMDVIAEPTWKCSRRLTEVSAHKPAASDILRWSLKFQNATKYLWYQGKIWSIFIRRYMSCGVSQNLTQSKECTILAGQAIGNYEGAAFELLIQYQLCQSENFIELHLKQKGHCYDKQWPSRLPIEGWIEARPKAAEPLTAI